MQNAEHRKEDGKARRSPGLLRKHYAPKAKLLLLNWRDDRDLNTQLSTLNPLARQSVSSRQSKVKAEATTAQLSRTHIIAHSRIPSAKGFGRVSVIPREAEAFARAIYAELHRCDEAGAQWIVVETPPATGEWRAIADRLKRASAD
jgi:L-threonylcarbamoyladenylate synthase